MHVPGYEALRRILRLRSPVARRHWSKKEFYEPNPLSQLDRLEGPGNAARRAELRRKAQEAARTRDRQAIKEFSAKKNTDVNYVT